MRIRTERESPPFVEKKSQVEKEEKFKFFLEKIKRPDIGENLSFKTPWIYWTMEIYRKDIKGQGGLGMLASDTVEISRKLDIPMVVVTPFYSREVYQEINNFRQKILSKPVIPDERKFTKIDQVIIYTRNKIPTKLDVLSKKEGSVQIISLTEPNYGELYQGGNNDNHRLYQEIALGFGGYKALKKLGFHLSPNQQLNEAPTVFSALSKLDELTDCYRDFEKALLQVRGETVYTNHTLVQAVEAEFNIDQFEAFVMPNIGNEKVRSWLRHMFIGRGGIMKLSQLALELADKRNGVSMEHARKASLDYKDYHGDKVNFEGITNGIAIDRWGDPYFLSYLRNRDILDEFDLPSYEADKKILDLDPWMCREIKDLAKLRLIEKLSLRKDQYGNPINIPSREKIFNWRRRIVSYKRPAMIFTDTKKLTDILEREKIHFIMAGRAHPQDFYMHDELKKIFSKVDANPTLKKRVHFIQDYDEEISLAISQGADVSINTPIVGNEACGTSWEKDILNNCILISTNDGGVADLELVKYLPIEGLTFEDELVSLYKNLNRASKILENKDKEFSWDGFVKRQLSAYLSTISGSRMMSQYLTLRYPK